MDAKGISWIGNIYQRFEAMCLEVEEIMYQDTVKFVEDQVESVGASVRKFYSEVMQDLDPPSSLDPGKVTAPEITLEKWDAGKAYKRPTTCIRRVSAKMGPNRFTKGSVVLGVMKKDAGHASSVKRLNIYRKPSSNSIQGMQLMKREGKTESRSICESLAAETQPQSEASGMVPPSERTETLSLQVLSKNPRTMKHQDTTVNSGGVEMARGPSMKDSVHESGQQNGSINDSSPNIPPTNINTVDECIENNGRKTAISSPSADSDGTSSCAALPIAAVSDVRENSYFKIPVNTDGADIGLISGNSSIEHNLITLDKPDWGNLDESCIFIDVDGHHSISQSRGKRRSYKKTIRDAFSSKQKASRAREYEQLAVLYDDAVSPQDCSAKSGKGETSEAQGSSECDWELL